VLIEAFSVSCAHVEELRANQATTHARSSIARVHGFVAYQRCVGFDSSRRQLQYDAKSPLALIKKFIREASNWQEYRYARCADVQSVSVEYGCSCSAPVRFGLDHCEFKTQFSSAPRGAKVGARDSVDSSSYKTYQLWHKNVSETCTRL
jgi:hypothetical protein